jgi:hypothetical protein
MLLGERIANWNLLAYEGKAILIGSERWVEETLDAVSRAIPPWVSMVRERKRIDIVPYINFIYGVVLIGDLQHDCEKLCGWCCRRGLFVVEQYTWLKHSYGEPRYLDMLDGLKCGDAEVWWA